MTSMWPSAVASLDASLALLDESLRKLHAADDVDIAQILEQFKTAADSARNLHAMISAELPEATWQNRRELDAIIEEQMEKTSNVAGGILTSESGPGSCDRTYQL